MLGRLRASLLLPLTITDVPAPAACRPARESRPVAVDARASLETFALRSRRPGRHRPSHRRSSADTAGNAAKPGEAGLSSTPSPDGDDAGAAGGQPVSPGNARRGPAPRIARAVGSCPGHRRAQPGRSQGFCRSASGRRPAAAPTRSISPGLHRLTARMLADPNKLAAGADGAVAAYMELWQATAQRLMAADREPVVEPAAGDKRFNDPDWSERSFRLHQAVLPAHLELAAGQVTEVEGVDAKTAPRSSSTRGSSSTRSRRPTSCSPTRRS